MSLSFVASAVQTGTESGGFEEKPIESKEVEAVNRRNQHKPLIEQLRENREKEEERKAEIERDRMRSTCALDDDDIEHLNAVERQQQDKQRRLLERTRDELAEFRAARLEKQQFTIDEKTAQDAASGKTPAAHVHARNRERTASPDNTTQTPRPVVPKILVKKKRKRATGSDTADGNTKQVSDRPEDSNKKQNTGHETKEAEADKKDSLGLLLGDYGSSDDEST